MDKNLEALGESRFYELAEERKNKIANASGNALNKSFPVNDLAAKLHPAVQHVIVAEAKSCGLTTYYKLVPDKEAGTESLAPAQAGQYVVIYLEIDGVFTSRRYSLATDPEQSENYYELAISSPPGTYFPAAIAAQWHEGTKATISAPCGTGLCYNPLRDAKHIIGVCSAVSAFRAMAYDIVAGRVDCRLTLLVLSLAPFAFVYDEDMARLESISNGKIKVVRYVLNGGGPGLIPGVPKAEDVIKYAEGQDYSLFFASISFLEPPMMAEISKLGLPPKKLRREISGELPSLDVVPNYPKENEGKTFKLKVTVHGKTYEGECCAKDSLLRSCELLGIKVVSECRSGSCGWCRSKLVSGDVFVPKTKDGRREADFKFGWIHPCASYPLSDIELEVFQKNPE